MKTTPDSSVNPGGGIIKLDCAIRHSLSASEQLRFSRIWCLITPGPKHGGNEAMIAITMLGAMHKNLASKRSKSCANYCTRLLGS
ncbi:hypothetical protein ISP15_05395 [Dyella jejuensis]|uniref:Uncharacterized protein n=1 Tax=Dyella jejuensis TaxID=1432009 RepID=A0ABW8JFA1_9GAMM